MKIVDVVPNSDEWLQARAGIVTASCLSNIVTDTFAPRTGKMPETYLFELLAERCMGSPIETGGSWAMDQGQVAEREARSYIAATLDVDVQRVGLITTDDGMFGCSPDGLLGEGGGLELKFPQPPTHLKYLTQGGVPAEYMAQVHGSLFASGRPWWLFVSYSRQFPPHIVRVERDDKIMAKIGEAVAAFNTKLSDAYAKMKALAREEDQRTLPPHRQFRPLIF